MAFDASGISRRPLLVAIIVLTVVFSGSLSGIRSRSVGFLAAFRPASALLLGLFIRCPGPASWRGGVAALSGYAVADLATGGGLAPSAWFTAEDLARVAGGVTLYRRARAENRALRRPCWVLVLFVVLSAAAAACAIEGAA